jgi:ribonuclease HI
MIRSGVLYCDGASRGNPGPAAIGAVLYGSAGEELATVSGVIGDATNNVAEYRALIAGLEAALDVGIGDIEVRLDSQLLVRQVTGEYRVKAANLKPLSLQAARLLRRFERTSVVHVPRHRNTVADQLANDALDASEAVDDT